MADFFKGLTGGFGTGLQLGQSIRQRRMEDELGQAYAKPETSQGYTAETGQQLEEYAKSGAYDIVPQYAPPAEGQTQGLFTGYQAVPKVGVDSPGSTPLAPIAFNPRQVQDYGGQRVAGQFDPAQLRGLQAREAARILGSYGDVRGAAALEAQAATMETQAAEQAFQAKYRPLQLRSMEDQIAGQVQQRELTGLQLKAAGRTETELQNASNFADFAAKNPSATTQELKDAAFREFKFTPKQWQEAVNTRLGIKENEQKDFVLNIKDKLKGKNLTQLGTLYNTDPDFDDKTDLAIVPGKGGAVTLNFIDKATKKVTSTQTFKNDAMAVEYLNKQATEPEIIGSWMMNLRKTESAIAAQDATARASDSTVALRGAQLTQLKESAANSDARFALQEKFDALTDAQKNGAEGDAIIKQFNLLNVKAGGQVGLRAPAKAAGRTYELTDLDKENLRYYRDWLKEPRNAKAPQGEKDRLANDLGITDFVKRPAEGPATGLGSNAYAIPAAGTPAAAARPPAPAAARTPAPAAAPAAPVLTTQNTKILSAAGNDWNVELPDGTTRIMTAREITKLGYKFLDGR